MTEDCVFYFLLALLFMKYCLFRKHAALCYDRPLPGDPPSVSATVSGRCIMDRVSFEGGDPVLCHLSISKLCH